MGRLGFCPRQKYPGSREAHMEMGLLVQVQIVTHWEMLEKRKRSLKKDPLFVFTI
jgi:hypothetical protein